MLMINLIWWLVWAIGLSQSGSDLKNRPASDNFPADQPFSNKYITGVKYLTISEIRSVEKSKSTQFTFRLEWDASWKDEDSFDAAWIFVKIKDKMGHWNHAKLVPNSAKEIENRTSDHVVPSLQIASDRIGMFVSRSEPSQGQNDWTISLEIEKWDGQIPEDVKIFGLEMVYVSEGSFELGTLKSEQARREVLTPGAGGAPYNPFFKFQSGQPNRYGGVFTITSESPINIGREDGSLYWVDANIPGTNTFSGVPKGHLAERFPKGFNGFFQMKYELSQQEYCNFLNALTPEQQAARDITSTKEFSRPIQDYRNNIQMVGGRFVTNRPHRPCNFISWLDGQAYADWAGLRHMTELEFEKSCRGPEPAVYREYIWGVNEIEVSGNMQYSTSFFALNKEVTLSENGAETTDGNIHASMFSYFNLQDVCSPQGRFYDPDCVGCRGFRGGDGGRGPVRKGIFGVTSGGDRIMAGAAYYGAMEMGGNLQEPVVTVGHPSGRRFRGTHGDGILSDQGFATNEDWMPEGGEYAFGGRGGCWKFHENHARTSDRFKGLRTNANRRASHIGFRGVRTSEGQTRSITP